MRQNPSRTQPRTDIDLALERTGSMRSLSAHDRAAFIRVAELLGCDVAAQHIRDDERRRERVHAAPAPAPRPGPKPRPTPPRQPVMNLLQGGGSPATAAPEDPWTSAIEEVAAGFDRGLEVTGLATADRDHLLQLRTLARLAGRLPARELRAADPTRPPA